MLNIQVFIFFGCLKGLDLRLEIYWMNFDKILGRVHKMILDYAQVDRLKEVGIGLQNPCGRGGQIEVDNSFDRRDLELDL